MEGASGNEEKSNLVFLCIDASENAYRAFDWFYNNFYRPDHTIGLVHIHTLPVAPHSNQLADIDNDYTKQYDEIIEKANAVVQRFLNLCTEYGVAKVVVFSAPKGDSIGRTICDMVKEHRPSSIVMGQRGLGVVKRALYGSVSDFLLHHAHIPVVVIPPPKESKE